MGKRKGKDYRLIVFGGIIGFFTIEAFLADDTIRFLFPFLYQSTNALTQILTFLAIIAILLFLCYIGKEPMAILKKMVEQMGKG